MELWPRIMLRTDFEREQIAREGRALNRAARCEYALRLCLKKLIPEGHINEVVRQVRDANFSQIESLIK